MKKIVSLLVAFLLVFTLAACGDNNQVPDDILDCFANPDDPDCEIPDEVDCVLNPDSPDCQVDCTVTPDDPACAVDCTVTPDDPACAVDCTITPNDPACAVDCTITPNDPACAVDCNVTPDDPSCPVVCDDGYQEILGQCVLIDNRTPEEILVDAILANWDGSMDHVDAAMELLDLEDAMEYSIEFNLEVVDGDGDTHVANVMSHDTYVYGDYDMMHRLIEVDFDGEMFEMEVILEETSQGANIYYNTDFLKGMLLTIENDPNGDIQDALDTFDANGTWFMFRFDDSLANLVEIEVLKEMFIEAFNAEFGENFFYEFQDEIEAEMGQDLELDYNINLGLFMEYVFDEDWVNAETHLDNIDWDGLLFDLDQQYLVPEIHDLLEEYLAEMLILDPTFDVLAHHNALDMLGTIDYLDSLTEEEILFFAEVFVDEDFAEVLEAHYDDELQELIFYKLATDMEFVNGLYDIPGLNVPMFTQAMMDLDFDAFYLENADLSMLPMNIYNGQMAFDAYVTNLALTAPYTASLLAPFSGTVLELEEYMVIIDDISYGFENLNMFAEYFDVAYYIENDMLLFNMEASEELELSTSITLDASESTTLFSDLMADVYVYLDGFQSFEMPYIEIINCPAGETECLPFAEYAEIVGMLGTLGDTVVTATYDPINTTNMEINFDFTSFLNSLIMMDDMNDSSIVDASITITVSESDGFDVPLEADVTDLNMLAEDFAKFSLVMKAYNYLEDAVEVIGLPTMSEEFSLSDFEYEFAYSYAFDDELSKVIVTYEEVLGIPVLNYEIDLYWLDGTQVFDQALGLDELALVLGQGMGAPDRVSYLAFIDYINEDNYNTTKLLLMYLWEQEMEEMVIPN